LHEKKQPLPPEEGQFITKTAEASFEQEKPIRPFPVKAVV
jgi:hypothetical protein